MVFLYLGNGQSSGISVDGTRMSEGQLQDVYADLCRTRALAEPRTAAARDLFFGRVHAPLHLIARASEDQSRPVAARMLEAKNDVEAAFNGEATGRSIAVALERLLTSTAEALRSLGVTTSNCEIP